jgi:hypothetical protein
MGLSTYLGRHCLTVALNCRPVLGLLKQGLYDALSHESKNTTVSSYLYVRIPRKDRLALFDKTKALFDKQISPSDYLNCWEKKLRYSVINALATMATTRHDDILKLA